MAIGSFDGATKIITIVEPTDAFNAQDLYEEWKDWVRASDNSKWAQAFETTGGDPISPGQTNGPYFFVKPPWVLRPSEKNHTLEITGNLLAEGGGDPFVNTLGNFNVRVMIEFSANTLTVATGASDPGPIADAVWNEAHADHTTSGTAGELLRMLRVLTHKLVTDPVSGTQKIYDTDESTVIYEADIFEDAAGSTAYNPTSTQIERRDDMTDEIP